MKALIIDTLSKQDEISESKFAWGLTEYKHAFKTDFNHWNKLSEDISNAFTELLKDNVITSRTELFDCGAGNGLAVERIYKLA